MKKINASFKLAIVLSICLSSELTDAQSSFQVIPLGVRGGGDESNLSSYMLAPANSTDFICLDAGTVRAGIEKAITLKTLKGPAASVLKQNIKAYLISHGHLDHLSGMVLNSPDDTIKNIYAFPFVIDVLKDKYFSWKSWANFADAGETPALKKYHYVALDSIQEIPLANTGMFVKTFILSHSSPYQSSAFLIRSNQDYVLYLGDTGADSIEHSSRLKELWQSIAPLIVAKKLKGIFIENSFPNEQPSKLLFGHLTPELLTQEMKVLAGFVGKDNQMAGLPVIITHMKPVGDNEAKIKAQLKTNNSLRLKFIFPVQGEKLVL